MADGTNRGKCILSWLQHVLNTTEPPQSNEIRSSTFESSASFARSFARSIHPLVPDLRYDLKTKGLNAIFSVSDKLISDVIKALRFTHRYN